MTFGFRFARLVGLGGMLALLGATPPTATAQTLTIHGIGVELGETPIVVPIDQPIAPGLYQLRAEGEDQARPQFVRILGANERTYLAWNLDQLGADQTRRFELVSVPETRTDQGIQIRESNGALDIVRNGQAFTTHHANVEDRKPYLHPVIGPNGKPFTRAYPMEEVEGEDRDHNHQRSFWFSHGDVDGHDFWGSDPLNRTSATHGTIQETAREVLVSGPVLGVLRTSNDWLTSDGLKLCEDERIFRFYDTETIRVIDLDVTIKASEGAVTFRDTKEGTFGLRLASSMNVNRNNGGRILNAEGITDGDAWGKASPWVDYNGPIDGELVGVAIFDHPRSFRHPTTWHVRDYGLFAANPFGYRDFGREQSGDHEIPAGESIRFHYRVILHEGDTESANIPSLYRAYAEPPRIEIQVD